ncbi:MAG: chemotaxis protein CheA, partial [Candidatus Korobacteraceae bacterium]
MAVAIDGMDEIIREFLIESAEGMDVLDRDLVALEREPGSHELLAEIFRTVHTLKGNSGALGYPKLESMAHAGENALGLLRDGKLTLSSGVANGLLAMVDALRGLLKAIEETGNEGDGNYRSVVDLLKELSESSTETNETSEELRRETLSSGKTESLSSEEHISQGLKPDQDDKTELTGTPKGMPLQNASSNRVSQQPPRTLSPSLAAVSPPASEDPHDTADASAASVRVNVGLLDRMMNLVGELVLTRNQVLHSALRQSDASFANAAQRLKSVTSGLQESVMKARMQPIGKLWNKLPRLLRDMAAQCGKQVAIEMKGSEIELDRTILEAMKDPLTHILRNAIDHGIESPERRAQAGKTAAGHVSVSAFHEGGRVHVEISDDGAGINLPRVRERAAERGLITVQQAASMNEQELMRLVFTPGFSTAETVTNLSGRGVGLDVVKTNIERIGGIVDLQSVAGHGTTLKVNLPLTLAVLPALIVNSGGERFAIPQASLIELVRLEAKPGPNAIEHVYGAAVYRWRDGLLPLVFLDSELQLPPQKTEATYVIVLEAGAQQFGLVVDAISDTEEIVIKPFGRQLRGLGCFAGAAILGDGRVALILDVAGV